MGYRVQQMEATGSCDGLLYSVQKFRLVLFRTDPVVSEEDRAQALPAVHV